MDTPKTMNNNEIQTPNKNDEYNTTKRKEVKLPPVSSISNSSFLWDPDVDGDMVNIPLAPQV